MLLSGGGADRCWVDQQGEQEAALRTQTQRVEWDDTGGKAGLKRWMRLSAGSRRSPSVSEISRSGNDVVGRNGYISPAIPLRWAAYLLCNWRT